MKLQSFYILKFSSSRLKDYNYNIEITLDQARQNNEVVRLANSELLRFIHRIRDIEFDPQELKTLIKSKKRNKDSAEIQNRIDKILYVPDIIDVEFTDARHYKSIIDKGGIKINGKNYIRLLAGAGMTRRSTVMFCNSEIYEELNEILNCGRNKEYPIVPSKFNAYYALSSSATWRVSTPNFVIIPDCEIEKEVEVDFLHESNDNCDPLVSPEKKKLKFNLFDGQGLISPRMAKIWSQELDIHYLPASWVYRSAFLKGLLVTFNFHKFARENGIEKITDIYGETHWVERIDVIVSESQFKLWGAYTNTESYKKECEKYDFAWGVTKYSPYVDKDYCFGTYQYLQNLNITTRKQIENLCSKTVEWFSKVTGDWIYSLLFLLGDVDANEIDSDWFESLDNDLLQILLLEPQFINDKNVQQKILRLINKKIRESYLGVLLLDGNYQFMIADPVAQIEYALGLPIKGLLKEGEHYSSYWNNKEITEVAALRSPMTFRSEVNILNLQNNEEMQKWYEYLYSGIVFNVFGNDALKMSGCDWDGDICMTTSQKEFIECAYTEYLPPAYERKTAEKKIIDENELWEYDVKTFKSRIGLYTNIGTELFAMLALFEEGSKEYNEVLNRLKICNCLQSMEIDRAKGIQTLDMPKYWTVWQRIEEKDTEEEKYLKILHQKTIVDKRPYFFRYLYSDYNQKYKDKQDTYSNYYESKFGELSEDILSTGSYSGEYFKVKENYYKYGELLDSPCVMNNICHYMENQVQEIKVNNRLRSFDYKTIIDPSKFHAKNKVVIQNIYDKYKQYRATINYRTTSSGFENMMQWLRNEAEDIIFSSEEIVWWASQFGTGFVIDVFGEDLKNVLKERCNGIVVVPYKSDIGHILYMGSKYKIEKFLI